MITKNKSFKEMGIVGFKAIKVPGAEWIYAIQFKDGHIVVSHRNVMV